MHNPGSKSTQRIELGFIGTHPRGGQCTLGSTHLRSRHEGIICFPVSERFPVPHNISPIGHHDSAVLHYMERHLGLSGTSAHSQSWASSGVQRHGRSCGLIGLSCAELSTVGLGSSDLESNAPPSLILPVTWHPFSMVTQQAGCNLTHAAVTLLCTCSGLPTPPTACLTHTAKPEL